MNEASYRFRTFLLDISERQLFDDKTIVRLTPKAFDLLVYLVRNAGHLVPKDELMRAVWPEAFVEEGNLTRTIHTLRKVLGEDDNGNKFIETIPTVGYRFVATIDSPAKPHTQSNHQVTGDGNASTTEIINVNGTSPSVEGRGHIDLSSSQPLRTFLPGLAAAAVVGVLLAALLTGVWLARKPSNGITGVRASSHQTNNSIAYQNFKQGRLLIERQRKGDFEDAILNFEKAIELDPNYAAAYAGKADAKIRIFFDTRSPDDIVQARAAIERAIKLDESSSYAHTVSCRLLGTYDWEFKTAERECQLAVDLDKSDHEAWREWAYLLNVLGRKDDAIAAADKALDLAPISMNKRARGQMLYYARRYDEAIAQLAQIEETDPEFQATYPWLRRAYEMKGDYPHALEYYVRQVKNAARKADSLAESATQERIAELRSAFAESGWHAVLKQMLEPSAGGLETAALHAQLGEIDQAFESLNVAYRNHQVMMVTIGSEPRLDPIRSDPRFGRLLQDIRLR